MKKKIAIGLALILALCTLGSATVFGADDIGVYSKDVNAGFTLVALDGDGNSITPLTGVVGNDKARHIFEGVEKFRLEFTGEEDNQYLIFLIEPGDVVPTSSNIAYIDQKSATDSSNLIFDIYPSELSESGKYHLCISSTDETYKEIGTFCVAQKSEWTQEDYNLGDATCDSTVDVSDALAIMKYRANLSTLSDVALSRSDTNADGIVDVSDALRIMQYRARLIDSF